MNTPFPVVLSVVAVCVFLELSSVYFEASLALFIISSVMKSKGRDNALTRRHEALKVNLIVSSVLFAVSVIIMSVSAFAVIAILSQGVAHM